MNTNNGRNFGILTNNFKRLCMKLENSDAIILLSVIYASENGKNKVSIGQIISSFDFTEHAIVTYDELKGALHRLTVNNYMIEINTLDFLPAKDIQDAFVSYKQKNKKLNFIAEIDFIKNQIHAKDWKKDIDYIKVNAPFTYKNFTPEIYKAALDIYLKV